MQPPRHPTRELYGELQTAFAHFNERLFDNALKPALITLVRKARTRGYCSLNRFVAAAGADGGEPEFVNEIALNPSYFAVRSIMETLSTLVHEMCHQWQFELGEPPRSGYHDTEWATKMLEVGLCPSDTGEPGGKRVGQKITHYLIKGGAFHRACEELLTQDFALSWLDRFPDEGPRGSLVLFPHPDEVQERRQALVDVLLGKGMEKDEVKAAIAELERQSRVADIGHTPDGSTCISMKILDGNVLSKLQSTGSLSGLGELDDDLSDVVDALRAVVPMDDEAAGRDEGAEGAAVITTLPAGGLGQSQSLQNVRVTDLQILRATAVAKPLNAGIDLPKPKAPGEKKTDKSNRLKYLCTTCHTQIWGRPNIRILCGNIVHKDVPVVMLPDEPSLKDPPKLRLRPEDEAMAGIDDLKFPSASSKKAGGTPKASTALAVELQGELLIDGKPARKRITQENPVLLSRLSLALSGDEQHLYGSCEILRVDLRKMAEWDEPLGEQLMGTVMGEALLATWQNAYALPGEEEDEDGADHMAVFVKAMGGIGNNVIKGRDHLVILSSLQVPGEPGQLQKMASQVLQSYATSNSVVVAAPKDVGQRAVFAKLGFVPVRGGFMVLPLKARDWLSRKKPAETKGEEELQ